MSVGYKEICCCGVPRYLKKGLEMKLIAKYRCENGELGKYKWRREVGKTCRICKDGQDTIEHWMNKYNKDRRGI